MNTKIHNLKIEKAKNGYIVYANENLISLTEKAEIRQIFVFETKESLFKFIDENFSLDYYIQ